MQGASSSSRPAGRWRDSSWSFQRSGPACPQRCGDTDTQVGSSGLRAGRLEDVVLKPTGRGGRAERREARGSPHASFNSGMSVGGGRRKAERLPERVMAAQLTPLRAPRTLLASLNPSPLLQAFLLISPSVCVRKPEQPVQYANPFWPCHPAPSSAWMLMV